MKFGSKRIAGRAARAICVLLLAAHCSLLTAFAQYGRPPESSLPRGGTPEVLKNVSIEQKLNSPVPLDAVFRDEEGREVRLRDYFQKGKPVVLALVYYECPMMCNQILNSLSGSLIALSFTAGQEFEVVTVSFDAREQAPLAAQKKATYMKRYGRAGAEQGWHFLTGEQSEIDQLTRAVGFNYVWDEQSNQFAHSSAIMVATPEGRLSHYFYGIDYAPKDIRLALVQASAGKIGTAVDQLVLYCYHYDPIAGKFAPVMMVVRTAGVLTVAGLVGLVFFLSRRRRGGSGRGGGRGGEGWETEIDVGGARLR